MKSFFGPCGISFFGPWGISFLGPCGKETVRRELVTTGLDGSALTAGVSETSVATGEFPLVE